ncbi:MAG: hypothetical protein ACTSYS_07315 [Promethearchaeota archaeon]
MEKSSFLNDLDVKFSSIFLEFFILFINSFTSLILRSLAHLLYTSMEKEMVHCNASFFKAFFKAVRTGSKVVMC